MEFTVCFTGRQVKSNRHHVRILYTERQMWLCVSVYELCIAWNWYGLKCCLNGGIEKMASEFFFQCELILIHTETVTMLSGEE